MFRGSAFVYKDPNTVKERLLQKFEGDRIVVSDHVHDLVESKMKAEEKKKSIGQFKELVKQKLYNSPSVTMKIDDAFQCVTQETAYEIAKELGCTLRINAETREIMYTNLHYTPQPPSRKEFDDLLERVSRLEQYLNFVSN